MSEFMENFSWLNLRHAVEHEPTPLDFVLPGFKSGTVGHLYRLVRQGKQCLRYKLPSQYLVALTCSISLAWTPYGSKRLAELYSSQVKALPMCLMGVFYSIGEHLKQIEKETVFTNLHVAPLVGRGVDVMMKEWRRWLANVTRDARLVIFDTLRRFHKLDENDGGHMSGLLAYMEQLCRENSTTVLFRHHTSKVGALNGGDSQQASRGSSVLTDNARFQANLIGMTLEQAKQFNIDENCRRNFVRLSFPKINYSAPIED